MLRFRKEDGTAYPDLVEKRLSDIMIERTTKQCISEDAPLLSFTIEQGVIDPSEKKTNKRDFLTKDMTNKKYALIEYNDIIYNPSNIIFGAIGRNKFKRGVVSPIYAIFETTEMPEYVELLVSNKNFINRSLKYLEGTVVKLRTLKPDDFLKLKVNIPCREEQEKIVELFSSIDDVIDESEKEIENLKNQKKALLQKMFPKKEETVPEVRFPGFTGDWEQRKAMDIADYSKGSGYSKSDLTEIGTPIILYGRLYTKYQFAIDEVDTFATPKDGSIYSQGNEVIIPASGETAEDIARASAVEKSGVLLGGDLNILRPFNFINPLFLALAISNGEPQKELAKKAQGKSVVHIHNSDIQEVSVSFPTRAEQDRIVAVFRNLDHLITLHQRELDAWKKLKQGLLQQMFV